MDQLLLETRMLKRSNIGGLILAVFGLLWFAVAVQAQVVDTICFNSTPPAFLNNSLPEGSNGVYTYEWQDSTASGSWQMAQGANTDTSYQSGALTEDTYFRRKSVSLVCGEEAYSNEVMIMVYDELDTNQVDIENTTCPERNDGSLSLSVIGGAGNYAYAWSNGDSSSNITDLAGGVYDLTVTDQAGCSFTSSFEVQSDNESPMMSFAEDTLFVWSSPVIGSPGSYDQYLWSTSSTDSTTAIEASGSYTLTVFNEAGCSTSDTVFAVLILGQKNLESLSLKIFPNPTRDLLHVQLSNNEMPQMLSLYDLAGNKVLEVENADELNVTSIAAGVYTLSIQLQGSTFLKRVIIQ